MDTTGFAFPFKISDALGRVETLSGDAKIRAKIAQVVLTAPGERVNLPTFGCGLRDLVFDPNNDILAATTEFAITRALQEWIGDEILVDRVDVAASNGELVVDVVYVRRDQLERGKVKIIF
jgi:phage baseplate assembly protein W